MDLYKAIQELRNEKEALDRVIASLERLVAGGSAEAGALREEVSSIPGRRGRKSMSADERRVVSERMRRYWEKRRATAGKS